MSLMSTYNNIEQKKKIIISFLIGFFYAISDELHQWFIPGRSALVGDIIIDSCGVLFGIVIIMFIIKFCRRATKKVKNAK